MFNSTAIEVVLGLVFIYLLYSLLATVLQEIIAHRLRLRPRMLLMSIAVMLDKAEKRSGGFMGFFTTSKKLLTTRHATKEFYNHPSIKFLGENDSRYPSSISADSFSQTLIRMLNDNKPLNEQIAAINEKLKGNLVIDDPETRQLLQSFLVEAGNDINAFKAKLENWYCEVQNRAVGWYKRQTQVILMIIGLGIAVANNVDSIAIYKILSTNSNARTQLANAASAFNEREVYKNTVGEAGLSNQDIDALNKHFEDLNEVANESKQILGLGWGKYEPSISKNFCAEICLFFKLVWNGWIGWLITALMISLGAPFWFSILNKVMLLRGSKREDAGPTNTSSNSNATPPAQPVVVNVNGNNGGGAVG